MKNTLIRRVYYKETDAGGVVYYGTYLGWLEEGRTELLRDMKVSLPTLKKEQNIEFAIREVNIVYHSPAQYDDEVTIITKIAETTATTILFDQKILKGEKLIVEAKVRGVTLRIPEFKPTRIPKDMLRLFKT